VMKSTVLILLSLLVVACASTDSEKPAIVSEIDITMTDDGIEIDVIEGHLDTKARILKEMEKRMRVVLGETVRRFEEIRRNALVDQEKLRAPFVIETVLIPIRQLYEKEEAEYETTIGRVMERYLAEIDAVTAYVLEKVWEIAFDVVGTEDVGTGYDTRTGIRDVDDVVEATIELVRFRAGRGEFVDEAEYLKRKRNGLSRVYKHDEKEKGRLCIYATESLYHYYSPQEDGIAYSAVFRNQGSAKRSVAFRQAVRNRVTRGGSNIFDSGFHWDSSCGSPDGFLPAREGMTDESYLVSQVFLPRLDLSAQGFDKLRDYTALRDYKTAVIDTDTGEILDCVSWQLVWQISYNGVVSVDRGSAPLIDRDAREIVQLLSKSSG
jgi:hypothetical protein